MPETILEKLSTPVAGRQPICTSPAPAGISPALAQRMSAAIGEVLREPRVVELLHQQFMEPAPGTPAEFKAFMQEELARWKPVIEQNKITAGQ